MGKDICHPTRWPEFDPSDPYGRREDSCKLSSALHMCAGHILLPPQKKEMNVQSKYTSILKI